MKLSQIKELLREMDSLAFRLPDGQEVPRHFHLTEIGKVTKEFIDCGGNHRRDQAVNFQLFHAQDHEHRLAPQKLLQIIERSEKSLALDDLQIEVEYQGRTLEKFNLDFDGTHFLLTAKHTDCLAKDSCGIPSQKPGLAMADLGSSQGCSPKTGCC